MSTGKLMGPKLGEATDGVPWGYRVWFPVVALFRMAHLLISPLLFFINFIIGREKENVLVVMFQFKILTAILQFSWELLSWLKFLLWLGSYYLLIFTQTILCLPYSCFLAVYGNPLCRCSSSRRRSQRKLRRSGRLPMAAFNEKINDVVLFKNLCRSSALFRANDP